ncbi:MAG: tetratricopeptide repeat protein [Candidatus Scalinduaceae bacterium]
MKYKSIPAKKMKIIIITTLSTLLFSYPSARLNDIVGQVTARAGVLNAEEKEVSNVDYEALAHRSEELNPNKNPDEVIALLEPHRYNKNNKSFIFYNSLGLAYKKKGRFKEAIAAYVHSLELEPNEPGTQYNLGIAYFNNNELSKALSYILKSAEQRPHHSGTKKWIDHLTKELNVYKVPDISGLKLVFDKKINVNKKKPDKESRLRMYITHDGGRIQVLSVDDKIYSYGIDSDNKKPVDYVIIDNDGDGSFEKIINSNSIFGVPTWAYNPE